MLMIKLSDIFQLIARNLKRTRIVGFMGENMVKSERILTIFITTLITIFLTILIHIQISNCIFKKIRFWVGGFQNPFPPVSTFLRFMKRGWKWVKTIPFGVLIALNRTTKFLIVCYGDRKIYRFAIKKGAFLS